MRGRADFDPDLPRDRRHDYWGVVLDCRDAAALTRFYSQLLGWEVATQSADGAALLPPDGVGYLAIQQDDEYVAPTWPTRPGRQQMQLHLDFEVEDLDAAAAQAIELGASRAEFQPQDNVRVMLDPAGHPFCLYQDA